MISKGFLRVLIVVLLIVIPYFFSYRAFFTNSLLIWGDAPYFYQENLKQLFSSPLLWDFRNDNFGGSQAQILWLFVPTFFFGLFNHLFSWDSSLLIRLIFYFPGTILALVGSWFFIGRFIKTAIPRVLGTILYGFNTYFLMVVDGGQVGMVLAYGLFPLVLWSLFNLLTEFNFRRYLLSLTVLFVLTNIDLRVAIIALVLTLLWLVIQEIILKTGAILKGVKGLALLLVSVLVLDLFWILPFIIGRSDGSSSAFSITNDLNLLNLTHSFLLFQPHFPVNEFGNVLPTPFYFAFLPIIILSGLLIKRVRDKRFLSLSLLFLLFVFLSKGGGDPLGEFYNWLVTTIPFGIAFRDSTKFYIPALLLASILLALSVAGWGKILRGWQKNIASVLVYVYLLFLVYPALLGQLSGVLSWQTSSSGYTVVYERLQEEPDFFRTLWFRERPQLAFTSIDKPALSANTLYQERPFASMIDGDYDLFGFLHNPQLNQWFNLLGVKYLFFPEDERKKSWTLREKEERLMFLRFVSQVPGFSPLAWSLPFAGYQTPYSKEHLFMQKEALLVVGGEEIYRQLIDIPGFNLSSQGFIFLEDGLFDHQNIDNLNSQNTRLIFANKKPEDLAMIYLEDKFISPLSAVENQWARRSSREYLKWKAELLEKGLRTYEFDFGKGIAFSTRKNEKIIFEMIAPKKDIYYLGIRYTNASTSAGLKINFVNQETVFHKDDPEYFKWELLGPFDLEAGKQILAITNIRGLGVLNTVGLFSQKDLQNAQDKADKFIAKTIAIEINQDQDWKKIIGQSFSTPVVYQFINPTQAKIRVSSGTGWIIFSDSYDPRWEIVNKEGKVVSKSQPMYAMINGFYLDKVNVNEELILIFSPQQRVNQGIFLSISATVIIIIVSLVWFLKKRRII